MKTLRYTAYAPDKDITFVMEYVLDGNVTISAEVLGFYFGKPDESRVEDAVIKREYDVEKYNG